MPTKPQMRRGTESVWQQRRQQPGWLLLPLRAFLGCTFVYAGLQKLANPDYLDPGAPTSVVRQMTGLRHSTPLGPLLGLSLHAPTLVGLLIAFGELAVGLGTLLGLLTRVAAIGGALLALTFFLTVSWATTPYYYGADIVFVFAWTVLIAFGSGGVLSLDGWLADRARRDVGLGRRPAQVTIAAPRLKELCARGAKCGLDAAGVCRRPSGCPIFAADEKVAARTGEALARRTVVVTAIATAVTGAAALATAGLTAIIGRAIGGTPKRRHVAAAGARTSAPASTTSSSASGTVIAAETSVGVGDAKAFTNPADGNPAFLVRTSATKFVAFSAVCTHAGCPVQFDKANTAFVCPCHGGAYDARTGQVLQGPPPAPLAPIAVQVVGGQVRTG